MEKKYQVFVSSTYQDFTEERKEVIQALLELDCIPVGMEMFPATDDDQWTLIKGLIDDCDYYILIVGARYGSLSNEGISYTQMEFQYALDKGIPIISFLHKSPDSVPVSKTDKNEGKRKKLDAFRALASTKHVKFWESPVELGSVVSRSLIKLTKTHPRTGWVKADNLSSEEAQLEILQLKEKLAEYEASTVSIDTIQLAQGDDGINLDVTFKMYPYSKDIVRRSVVVTWENLFKKTCPKLIDESTEEDFREHLTDFLIFLVKDEYESFYNFNIVTDDFIQVLIQFKALGLIEKSIKKRAIKDNNTYWKLTSKGDHYLTKLRAIRREVESK